MVQPEVKSPVMNISQACGRTTAAHGGAGGEGKEGVRNEREGGGGGGRKDY